MARPFFIDMTLEGGKELEAKMLLLELTMQRKINRKVVRAAIKTILAPAKANARAIAGSGRGSENRLNDVDMSESIAQSLQIAVGTYKGKLRRGQYYMKLQHSSKFDDIFVYKSQGVARPAGKRGGVPSRRTYIPAAIEYGHIAPNGRFIPPKSYLRRAFTANVKRAASTLKRELFSGIERAWRVG